MQEIESIKGPPRENVGRMFDLIAWRYDFLNRLLSFQMDTKWRSRMADCLPEGMGITLLDLATGTADVPISLFKIPGKITQAVGIDISGSMLEIGRQKIKRLGLSGSIRLQWGDAMNTGFETDSFDAATMAFGIRNVTDTDAALREILRVLKPGGKLIILEFSIPEKGLLRSAYLFYFRHVLPLIGKMVSGDNSAYRYLNQTVETYPYGKAFCGLLDKNGFFKVERHILSGGIASIYTGIKPQNWRKTIP